MNSMSTEEGVCCDLGINNPLKVVWTCSSTADKCPLVGSLTVLTFIIKNKKNVNGFAIFFKNVQREKY
jgi:hypothetical protein